MIKLTLTDCFKIAVSKICLTAVKTLYLFKPYFNTETEHYFMLFYDKFTIDDVGFLSGHYKELNDAVND